MHELSLGTWFIHIATVLEWTLAIIVISQIASKSNSKHLNWLSIAMLPNLASAMAAITWHIYDNDPALYGLVVLQAILTVIGNSSLALALFYIFKQEKAEAC